MTLRFAIWITVAAVVTCWTLSAPVQANHHHHHQRDHQHHHHHHQHDHQLRRSSRHAMRGCARCPPGWGVERLCDPLDGLDTSCTACRPGASFSPHHSARASCQPCTETCAPGRYAAQACTAHRDTVCAPCHPAPPPHRRNRDYVRRCVAASPGRLLAAAGTHLGQDEKLDMAMTIMAGTGEDKPSGPSSVLLTRPAVALLGEDLAADRHEVVGLGARAGPAYAVAVEESSRAPVPTRMSSLAFPGGGGGGSWGSRVEKRRPTTPPAEHHKLLLQAPAPRAPEYGDMRGEEVGRLLA